MWDSNSLNRFRTEAKRWFAPIGLETPLELYQRLYEAPLPSIHTSAFEELVTSPEIAIIEDAYISNLLLQEKLDIESFALGMKAIARITGDLKITKSGCESGSFFFQLESNNELNIIHELSIYQINGKKTLFWTNRVLVNSQNPGLFFEFRKTASDGSIKTFMIEEEMEANTLAFGTCTSIIHVPSLLTVLFYLGESDGGNIRPQEVRPVIFNLWDQPSLNPKFLSDSDQNEAQTSRFVVTTHAGYQLTELTESALDFLISQVPNVLTTIQTRLVDGYSDKKTSRFFHQVLGSESSMPVGGGATTPLAVGRWIPAAIAEQNAAWSSERYKEAWRTDEPDNWSIFLEILQEGCGLVIPHTINTLIYGYLIPQERFREGVELGVRGMFLPESDQTKNSQNNTAICYLKMGDINSAKELFIDSAENPYHSNGIYSQSVEEEAQYFLGVIAESEENFDLAMKYYASVVRSAGGDYYLTSKLALERLGAGNVEEVLVRVEEEMNREFQEGQRFFNDDKSQEGADIWMNLAKFGHMNSIEQLTYIFLDQKDFDYIETLFNSAKNSNDPIILYLKARKIEEEIGIDAALESFRIAADAGSPHSCAMMFDISIENQNIEEAELYLSRLVNHSDYLQNLRQPTSYEELSAKLEELIDGEYSDSNDYTFIPPTSEQPPLIESTERKRFDIF